MLSLNFEDDEAEEEYDIDDNELGRSWGDDSAERAEIKDSLFAF